MYTLYQLCTNLYFMEIDNPLVSGTWTTIIIVTSSITRYQQRSGQKIASFDTKSGLLQTQTEDYS